jgi:hypothetical protein
LMKETFSIHASPGSFFFIFSETSISRRSNPSTAGYPLFCPGSYFRHDGMSTSLKGNSLILSRTREFFLMIPWSVSSGIFEAANFPCIMVLHQPSLFYR